MEIMAFVDTPGKSLGDVTGAYKVLQALCKNLLTTITIRFIIMGAPTILEKLTNPDGSSNLAAPGDKVYFKVHLFDTEKAWDENGIKIEQDIEQRLKAVEEISISNIFSQITGEGLNLDLIILYNTPVSFSSSLLNAYTKHANIKLPKQIWNISEYNINLPTYHWNIINLPTYQRDIAKYNIDLTKYEMTLADLPRCTAPANLQIKMTITGFPDEALPVPTIGVLTEKQPSQKLTAYESNLLKILGYESIQHEQVPGLFLGYTHYLSTDTCNKEINLSLFVLVAIKQYLAFNKDKNDHQKKVSIVLPFSQEECESLAKQICSEYSNVSVQRISIVESLEHEPPNILLQKILDAENKFLRTEQMSIAQTDHPIVVRLINIFPMTPTLFALFSENAENLTIRTGDQSLIEAILKKKAPMFYQVVDWKLNYYSCFIDYIRLLVQGKPAEDPKFLETINNFLIAALGVLDTNPVPSEREKSLQKLIEIAINLESFRHMEKLFEMLANKIIQELNAGDKLRNIFKEEFPELEFQDFLEEKQTKELKCIMAQKSAVRQTSPIGNVWTPLYTESFDFASELFSFSPAMVIGHTIL